MALYDPNYLMMSQQLLNVFYDVKSFANFFYVSLACEDGNSKLVEVVDDEKQFTP